MKSSPNVRVFWVLIAFLFVYQQQNAASLFADAILGIGGCEHHEVKLNTDAPHQASIQQQQPKQHGLVHDALHVVKTITHKATHILHHETKCTDKNTACWGVYDSHELQTKFGASVVQGVCREHLKHHTCCAADPSKHPLASNQNTLGHVQANYQQQQQFLPQAAGPFPPQHFPQMIMAN